MQYMHRQLIRRLSSQEGFVLIVAIIAMMIMIALGFLALTVSTQDIRISSRMVGERKAFSAAEAGVNEMSRSLNPHDLQAVTGTKYDETGDPGAQFSATEPQRDLTIPQIVYYGESLTQAYSGAVYSATVTGRDTNYNSQTSIKIGIAYAPSPTDTQY